MIGLRSGLRALLALGILCSVRGRDPPDSVQVEVRTLDNGAVEFICVEDSSPPATNFMWKRKDTYDSDAVELGNGKTLSGENFQSGVYICEVTNPIGKTSGYLHFYKAPGSSECLYVYVSICLAVAFSLLAMGAVSSCWYKKQLIKRKKN
ncbi:uncharacterized protein LOC143981716 [Lithobates pipiens]